MRQCKSTKLLNKLLYLNLIEPDQSSMFYQLPMIKQTSCIM